MSSQELLLVAILVFVLMNIGLFLTIRESRKLAGDTSVKTGADTDLPYRMTRRLS